MNKTQTIVSDRFIHKVCLFCWGLIIFFFFFSLCFCHSPLHSQLALDNRLCTPSLLCIGGVHHPSFSRNPRCSAPSKTRNEMMTYKGGEQRRKKKIFKKKARSKETAEMLYRTSPPFFPQTNKQTNHFNVKTRPCVSAPAPSRGACGS